MNAIKGLLAIMMLVAGMLLGAHLSRGRAAAGEPTSSSPPSTLTGAMLVRTVEALGLQAARVYNHPRQGVSLSNGVRQLDPEAYDNLLAAVGAATRLPLMLEDEQVFLPLLMR